MRIDDVRVEDQGRDQGRSPMFSRPDAAETRLMPLFRLHHRHEADDCSTAYAAWKGFDSPLRHDYALSTCREGGHVIWWDVEALDERTALDLVPPYVAERTSAIAVSRVPIP